MEALSGSLLNVVLKIKEGNGFGFLTSPIIIVANLNGNALETEPIHSANSPSFGSDFVWEADKKVLRRMRCGNTSLRIECFNLSGTRKRDKIGYILLNLKQAQIVTADSTIAENWYRLLGVRVELKPHNPEILLSLFIKQADFNVINPPPPLPPPAQPGSATPKSAKGAALSQRSSDDQGYIQIGPVTDSDLLFRLTVNITSAVNLFTAVSLSEYSRSQESLTVNYALLGSCFTTKDLSEVNGDISGESMTMSFRSSIPTLVAYFAEFPQIDFHLKHGAQDLATASLDFKLLVPDWKNIESNRVGTLKHDSKLYFVGESITSKPYINVSLFLESLSKAEPVAKPFSFINSNSGGTKSKQIEIAEKILARHKANIEVASNSLRCPPQISGPEDVPNALNDLDPPQVYSESKNIQQSTKKVIQESVGKSGLSPQELAHPEISIPAETIDPKFLVPSPRRNDTCITKEVEPSQSKVSAPPQRSWEKVLRTLKDPSFTDSSTKEKFNNLDPKLNKEIIVEGSSSSQNTILMVPSQNNINFPLQEFCPGPTQNQQILDSLVHQKSVYDISNHIPNFIASINPPVAAYPPYLQPPAILVPTLNTNNLKACGDSAQIAPQQQIAQSSPNVVTQEMTKKICEELEDWKEKQQVLYKTELKKKLEREVKKLTEEWIKRQSDLEGEMAKRVEESCSLTQQLHKSSAELQARLATLSAAQKEVESQRVELERNYSVKMMELREASKRHHVDMQAEINQIKGERDELKAKLCASSKEIERLKNLCSDDITRTGVKSQLTDEQMTSLLVDMKGLEEKLAAALESKEFFRKEWGRALREIHRMKAEQEAQIKQQLDIHRQELDNLR